MIFYFSFKSGLEKLTKTLLFMKLTALLLLLATLEVSASGRAQKITISVREAPLAKVLDQVKRQTGYFFFYDYNLLEEAEKVSVRLKEAPIEEALNKIFEHQPLEYKVIDRTVVIRRKVPLGKDGSAVPAVSEAAPPSVLKGVVKDENGNPLVGASVMIKGSRTGTTTNENGEFSLTVPEEA